MSKRLGPERFFLITIQIQVANKGPIPAESRSTTRGYLRIEIDYWIPDPRIQSCTKKVDAKVI